MRGNRTTRAFLPQPRELRLLRELQLLRVVDRAQAQAVAGYRSLTRANTRLPRLVAHRLLTRFFIPSERGGKKAIYALSRQGAAWIGAPFNGIRRGRDRVVIGDAFVPHQLHINQIYIRLRYEPIPVDQVSVRQWRVLTEPLATTAPIIPDGYFELNTPTRMVCCFLEVDLGGETARTWKSKILAYLNFAVTGEFEQDFRQPQFRIVVVANSPRRSESIRRLAAEFTDKAFWISDFPTINRDGFWGPVWLRPTGTPRQSFL